MTPSPPNPTPEQLYEEVKALHDRICEAGYTPDMIDFLCMIYGWKPFMPTQGMQVTLGGKVYNIERIE